MTILERVRGRTDVADALRDAADRVPPLPAAPDARDLADGASGAATDLATDLVARAGDVVAQVGDAARQAGRDLGRRIDDVTERVRRELPDVDLGEVAARIERSLPDTDRDRYDRAFARGRARARSGFVGLGLVLGALMAALGVFLLDPARGRDRRAAIASRARSLSKDVARVAGGQAQRLSARSGATDAGHHPVRSPAPAPFDLHPPAPTVVATGIADDSVPVGPGPVPADPALETGGLIGEDEPVVIGSTDPERRRTFAREG